jgi:hypothetical protein
MKLMIEAATSKVAAFFCDSKSAIAKVHSWCT